MNHNLGWTLNLSNQLMRNLFQQTQEDMTAFTNQFGGFEESDQLLVQYAYVLSPEPLGLAHVFKRVPYLNPAVLRDHLNGAVVRGWLVREGEGAYGASLKGERYVEALMLKAEELYVDIIARSGISEEMLTQALDLLDPIDDGIELQDVVTEKYAWKMAHLFDNESVSLLAQVRRRLLYLLSYRDDAHVAAWSGHALDGYVWESFTRVWEGRAKNGFELAEQLPYRNYTKEDYRKGLDLLVKRRWMDMQEDADGCRIYSLTGKGVALREDVEVVTNRNYDAAFQMLSVHDLVELEGLLEKLAEALALEPVVVNRS